MAKNTATVSKASLVDTSALGYAETTVTEFTLPWGDTFDIRSIHPQGIAYLLAYGMGKTCQDAASGLIAKAETCHKAMSEGSLVDATHKAFKAYAADIGYSLDGCLAMDAADFARKVATVVSQARWAKVIAGEMDIPNSGNRLTGIARIIRDLAEETIKANAKVANIKLTDERLDTLVAQFVAGDSPKMQEIRIEAQRRMDAKAVLPSGDADILAMLKA